MAFFMHGIRAPLRCRECQHSPTPRPGPGSRIAQAGCCSPVPRGPANQQVWLSWEGDALPWKGISGRFVYEDRGVQKEMGGAQQNSQGGISLGGVGIQVGFSTHMLPDSLLGLGKGKALLHFRVLLPGDAGAMWGWVY